MEIKVLRSTTKENAYVNNKYQTYMVHIYLYDAEAWLARNGIHKVSHLDDRAHHLHVAEVDGLQVRAFNGQNIGKGHLVALCLRL